MDNGVTVRTIFEIFGNYPEDVKVSFGGPAKNGKYAGWITRGEEGKFRPLISTNPVFETSEVAVETMQKIIDICLITAEKILGDSNNPITQFLSSHEGQITQAIVEESKITE